MRLCLRKALSFVGLFTDKRHGEQLVGALRHDSLQRQKR
jgi:hypothetical protein